MSAALRRSRPTRRTSLPATVATLALTLIHRTSDPHPCHSVKQLPPRSKVKTADTWDLSSLFPSDDAWEKAFAAWEKRIAGYAAFQGTLGDDAETLAACLKFDEDFDRAGERLGTYALLKTTEDTADSQLPADAGPVHQRRQPRGRGRQLHPPGNPGHPRRPDEAVPRRRRRWPRTGCCSSGCCATSRTRSARRRKSCWPCRPRWPRPPARSSAN